MRIMNSTISVIMGAYNCAHTLPEAIAAIQHQTVSDWEFIICDDGSSDETWQVASEFQRNDERIVLLRNEKNLGLNATLNKCLAAASGYYIARMDGDDICTPDRFEKEPVSYTHLDVYKRQTASRSVTAAVKSVLRLSVSQNCAAKSSLSLIHI